MNALREAWNRTCYLPIEVDDVSKLATYLIAKHDDVAACAHPIDYTGMDIPDFEGLERRIVALLPQVMLDEWSKWPGGATVKPPRAPRPPRNYLRMFLTRIFPPLFAVNLFVIWYLA
ncbi:hypothetical protein [Ensifer aridi]|uniref:hypothetical protein n=1 Tax=Ensifer aridi TaxID=1708715 RepID=UPI0011251242|nr:hypothetical protein [Ensifer aridi]